MPASSARSSTRGICRACASRTTRATSWPGASAARPRTPTGTSSRCCARSTSTRAVVRHRVRHGRLLRRQAAPSPATTSKFNVTHLSDHDRTRRPSKFVVDYQAFEAVRRFDRRRRRDGAQRLSHEPAQLIPARRQGRPRARRPGLGRGPAHHHAAVQPRHARRARSRSRAPAAAGDRSEALRLKGPPVETIKLEAEIDATDQLEFPRREPRRRRARHPPAARGARDDRLPGGGHAASPTTRWRRSGRSRSSPREAPLTLFVWSAQRIAARCGSPSSASPRRRSTRRSTRSAPRSASACACCRVDDLGFSHKGGSLFMAYLRAKEPLVGRAPAVTLSSLGIGGIAMTEPLAHLEALLAAGDDAAALPAQQPLPRDRRTAQLVLPDGRAVVYLRRRFVPPPEAFAALREHVVVQGDRLDNLAAAAPRRPRAVLAALRRQRRAAARRADRDGRPAAADHRCPRASREAPMPSDVHLTLLIGPGVPVPAPAARDRRAGERPGDERHRPRRASSSCSRPASARRCSTTLLPAGYFDPIVTRVIVVATVRGIPHVLMDGVVTRQDIAPSQRRRASRRSRSPART